MKNLALIVTAAAVLPLAGCGTSADLLAHSHCGSKAGTSMVYGGVRTDVHGGSRICRQIGGSEEFDGWSIAGFFFAFIDTPLSFVLDTLLLPFTITADVSQPSTSNEPQDR